ncbi:uncharacterized protein G2W53_035167 [Senna tora]|uniref:Uncharacterized protein n=1 Tax=Senna tora TaxID=362788 RepID=A0A834T340_9FABA|nr:uncharacterized protein G2W53_035167 [Senna tora]
MSRHKSSKATTYFSKSGQGPQKGYGSDVSRVLRRVAVPPLTKGRVT